VRRPPADEESGGLDLLFAAGPEEPAEAPAEPERSGVWRWWLQNALVIAILTAAVAGGMRMVGVRLPIVLVVVGFVALRALWLIVAGLAPPPPVPPGPRRTAADDDGRYEFTSGDALRGAVRRWENRLQGPADAARFSRNVLPVLAELADERLRQRHGLTRASDPDRARELLGEPLWRLLEDPGRKPPKAKEWAAHVQALEKL
jgi:hypothetical protein